VQGLENEVGNQLLSSYPAGGRKQALNVCAPTARPRNMHTQTAHTKTRVVKNLQAEDCLLCPLALAASFLFAVSAELLESMVFSEALEARKTCFPMT